MNKEKLELEEKTEEEEKVVPPEGAVAEPQAEEQTTPEEDAPTVPNPDAGTPTATEGEPEQPNPATEAQPEKQPEESVRMFTQEQVNELIGKARVEGRKKGYEQARSEALARYGVENDEELDGLFANGTRYGELNRRYIDSGNSLKEAQTELALVKSQILPERQGDVKAILSANGLDVTEENILSLLPTHPEWKAQAMPSMGQASPAPAPEIPQPQQHEEGATPAIKKLGVEPSVQPNAEEDEREKAMRLFGLSKK